MKKIMRVGLMVRFLLFRCTANLALIGSSMETLTFRAFLLLLTLCFQQVSNSCDGVTSTVSVKV